MGKLPDKIIIVRHGARLDQTLDDARFDEFRSTEHGYDTALSYNGWRQSQALGQYLARLILYPGNPDRRRKKIILHTSPFTRCLQTSIGLASGFSEVAPFLGNEVERAQEVNASHDAHSLVADHPILSVGAHMEALLANSIKSPEDSEAVLKGIEQDYCASEVATYHKIVLRLEPFLREWLSETYFEFKHEEYLRPLALVRRATNIMMDKEAADGIRISELPGSYNPYTTDLAQDARYEPGHLLREHADLVARHSSISSTLSFKSDGTYNSPVPDHSLLPRDLIPRGYTAHARDACLQFDPSWVGVGVDRGYFPETWHSFHARIEGGIHALLRWYLNHPADQADTNQVFTGDDNIDEHLAHMYARFGIIDGSKKPCYASLPSRAKHTSAQDKNINQKGQDDCRQDKYPDADDEELVIILVTHAAGCNKLLNALTQRPVLVDFPQACLTIAVKNAIDACEESVLSDWYRVIVRSSIEYLNPTVSNKTLDDFIAEPRASRQPIKEASRLSRRSTISCPPAPRSASASRLWGKGDGSHRENGSVAPVGLWKAGGSIKRG